MISSVIPYVFDQLAMRRFARATYALMVALLGATAAVIGTVILTQIPTPTEILGVALVVAAVALHRGTEARGKGQGRRAPIPGGGGPRAAGVDFRPEVGGQPGSVSAVGSVRSLT